MRCHHHEAGRCGSCRLLGVGRADQVSGKERRLRELLDPLGDPLRPIEWLPAFTGAEEGFRNKAKMVVAGTVDAPTVGILGPDGAGVDLRDCGLHTAGLHAALPVLAGFITRAALTPYDVGGRRGELKHLLVTESDDDLMVRFVLRSTESLPRIRKHLPALLADLPTIAVVSANLQPEHKAVTEGAEEVVLHGSTLTMTVNGLPLHLRPRSFFQTNTEVAAALYRQARAWVDELAPEPRETGPLDIWDLYCGVGGFALHLAGPGRRVTGIEVSAEAVASALTTRDELGLTGVRFLAGDAEELVVAGELGAAPDLVVVNPPRRGIGPGLAGWLERSAVAAVLYSSCNAESLARDLAGMPSLRPVRGQLLDMFPQTDHYEALVLLRRS